MKEKFYVFLDIDGTLWDYKFLRQSGYMFEALNPESIYAVNYLVEKLSNFYDCKVVITSNRRCDWDSCTKLLHKFGISKNINLCRTSTDKMELPRGIQIAEFMKNDVENLQEPNKVHFDDKTKEICAKQIVKKMKNNFVVIDDKIAPIMDYVPAENTIQTNIKNQSLNIEMVLNYLKKFELENQNEITM